MKIQELKELHAQKAAESRQAWEKLKVAEASMEPFKEECRETERIEKKIELLEEIQSEQAFQVPITQPMTEVA